MIDRLQLDYKHSVVCNSVAPSVELKLKLYYLDELPKSNKTPHEQN